jgi:streptomycin 6-kinase
VSPPNDLFRSYLHQWSLEPDGEPIITPRAHLLPVLRHGEPAMLKVATEAEEKFGGLLMSWWSGDGAARVLAHDDDALLLERATSGRACRTSCGGQDDDATRITCRVIDRLHAPRATPLPNLVPLTHWFRDLTEFTQDGLLARAKAQALALLAAQTDTRPLHGDIHHDNILDFGLRGWLVIDPKRLIGDRTFDYVNLFCNPDFESASDSERFARRLAIVADMAHVDRTRLLQWLLAWCGLSAVWCLNDPDIDVNDPDRAKIDLKMAELAAAELDR